ncbi:MAG: 16S rRNA (guanine(527)-N(7))-methyltransferase RsmG [Bacteroidetes bacterium]|nr:16S rRNA (guanine(527)-N(7))-methyltransferase RsmG [Bacteroidota bacterium]
MDWTEFWTILSVNGIILEPKQIEIFKRYHKELIYWNEKINLISRQDESNILEKHFIHSLSILKYVDIPIKAQCLDIGTGGGFPGLVLKIARPDVNMILLDSIKKKINTTKMLAQHTELRGINCVLDRAENLCNEKKYNKYFDIILSRAVAKTDKLIGWTIPLIKDNGKFIFLKGGDLGEEINQAKNKYRNLNFEVKDINILGCKSISSAEKKIIIVHK